MIQSKTTTGKSNTRKQVDMTEGKPLVQILRFCVPLLLGNILQQLYNTVDSMVVGRFISSDALAAVGTSGPVINLMIAIFMGLSAGTGILISQAYGAKDFVLLQRIIHTITVLTVAVGAAVSLLGIVLTPQILTWLATPPEVMDAARTYMTITFLGILTLMLYNLINAVLQGTGDSRSPFLILLTCCCINIVLDLLFVIAFGWGVAGVAWATMIAQGCSVLFGVIRVNSGDAPFRLQLKLSGVDREIAASICRLGIPAGMQNGLTSIGNILVQGVINSFGPVIMAANIAVIKVDSLCIMPIMTFGTAVTVYVGQNVGAGNHSRIREGVKVTLILSVVVSLVISLILVLFGDIPLALFTREQAVIQAGMDKFYRVAPFYFCIGVFGVLSGMLRGQGHTIAPMLIGVATMFAGRVPVAFLLPRLIGANGIHWSLSVQWGLEALIIVLYTFYMRRKSAPLS
ncbi:MATE family efflux transporter, partial [Ruminococcaceae bacterium OttesenSCG-928-L11]|nr:MATE family efflux transporter [Ruminococcaceae bacterium OttesenSCG-928-L11]